ncbi:MAG: Cell division trigger factor [Labilithrix sp.]|nr:Cell division trigger factor [Labilithrix sp.]
MSLPPMLVSEKRISPVEMELSIEIPADLVKAEVDKAYVNLGKKAFVKGFRPGKAPRDVLTRLYNPQVVNDVANQLVNDTLPKALNEKNITPVSQPQVEAKNIDPKQPFSFTARFEVQPEIADVKFEGFELYRPKVEVADAAVEEQLEGLRQRHAALKAPEPARPAAKGDVLTIDFTLSVEGKEIKDGGGQGVQIELGSGQALPEIDEALLGKNVGEQATAEHSFPAEHPRDDFRGKKGTFSITVADLKERVLPALDDELAKDLGFETLVALRADVHTKLEKAVKDRSETSVAEQIVEKLNSENTVDVPPSLVDQQCRIMEQEVLQSARRMGQRITQEQYNALHGAILADAEKKVRAGLLMAAIARKNEFKVTDEDIEKGLVELAAETGKNVAKLRVEYREKSKRDILIGMILEDKILDFIESKSQIKDGDPPAPVAAPSPEGSAEPATAAAASNDERASESEEKKEG